MARLKLTSRTTITGPLSVSYGLGSSAAPEFTFGLTIRDGSVEKASFKTLKLDREETKRAIALMQEALERYPE